MYLSEEVVAKFWTKVDRKDECECWPWKGRLSDGYGVLDLSRKSKGTKRNERAHRISFAISQGIDLEDIVGEVRHSCDNPPCVNPNHLLEGTHADNMRDKVIRGRHVKIPSKGSQNGNAVLTENIVANVRQRILNGETNTSIAASVGVHHSTISLIRRGKIWTD